MIEDNLQLAFLKTFPKTICLAADTNLEYPFYLMARERNLLKVHGSSVVTLLSPMPKWVCCQNLVLSSVTGRPMARVVVPIKEELIKNLRSADLVNALKLDKEKLPQKLVKENIPSAFIRFLRAKNHNEVIQRELTRCEAYLETDEDREIILYFYTKDTKKEEEHKRNIDNMVETIDDYMKSMAAKKNYLFSVSDRTKIQINHEGKIVDVLGSQEFLTFIIKSVDGSLIDHIKELAHEKGITEMMYSYLVSKDRNLISVHLNTKQNAKKLFDGMNKVCKKRKTVSNLLLQVFPVCGFAFDSTSKFKKWKTEIQWFEGPKSRHARIYCELGDAVYYVEDLIKKNTELR